MRGVSGERLQVVPAACGHGGRGDVGSLRQRVVGGRDFQSVDGQEMGQTPLARGEG